MFLNSASTRRVSFALIACLFCLLTRPHIQSSSTADTRAETKSKATEVNIKKPLWRVDLHPLGYPSDNPELQWRRDLDEFDTVDFVSENTVVATFVTHESIPEPQRRDDPNRLRPYRLHAIFLNSATGKVLKTLDWPADDPNTGIFPRYDGSFLFFSTECIVLYSADWKPMKELALPELTAPHSQLSGIAESPSGKVLTVRYHREEPTFCIQILTATLEASEGSCSVGPLFSISDNAMAANEVSLERNESTQAGPSVIYNAERPSGIEPFGSRIIIHERGQASRGVIVGLATPQFINNEEFVAYEFVGFRVFDHLGNLEFHESFKPDELWIDTSARPVRPSANGHRFAVAINVSPFSAQIGAASLVNPLGDPPAALAARVSIYDLEKQQLMYNLQYQKNQFQPIWGLGLSPSGEKLVIDSGGVIQTYSLP
jgi:hypothetical protein